MPSAFRQALKSVTAELTFGEEATPQPKRRKVTGNAVASASLQSSVSRAELATREETDTPEKAEAQPKAADEAAATTVEKPKAKGRRSKKNADAVAEGEAPEDGKPLLPVKKAKKAKPVGHYTKYKEDGFIPEQSVIRKELPVGGKSFKAISWNIGGLRSFAKNRPEALPDLVKQEQPDVLGILEHKFQKDAKDTESTMNMLLESLPDYECAAVHCSTAKKGYSGTLALVRKDGLKPQNIEEIDLPSAKDEGRLIVMDFEALTLVLAYVPNSGDKLQRLEERIGQFDQQLREKLQELAAKKPTLLIGDLNVAHRDEDIWNNEAPHVPTSAGTTTEERQSFSKLLEAGFADGYAHCHPEVMGAFTYWSVRAGNRPKNRGLRLDYAVVSRSLLQPSASAAGDEAAGSDASGPAGGDSAGKPLLFDAFHMPAMSTGDHCPVGAVFTL